MSIFLGGPSPPRNEQEAIRHQGDDQRFLQLIENMQQVILAHGAALQDHEDMIQDLEKRVTALDDPTQ